jgi:hypothetical protein
MSSKCPSLCSFHYCRYMDVFSCNHLRYFYLFTRLYFFLHNWNNNEGFKFKSGIWEGFYMVNGKKLPVVLTLTFSGNSNGGTISGNYQTVFHFRYPLSYN